MCASSQQLVNSIAEDSIRVTTTVLSDLDSVWVIIDVPNFCNFFLRIQPPSSPVLNCFEFCQGRSQRHSRFCIDKFRHERFQESIVLPSSVQNDQTLIRKVWMQEDTTTCSTPRKRPIHVPTQSSITALCTPPLDMLLQEFRAKNAAGGLERLTKVFQTVEASFRDSRTPLMTINQFTTTRHHYLPDFSSLLQNTDMNVTYCDCLLSFTLFITCTLMPPLEDR